MGTVKDFLGIGGENKGSNCVQDETGKVQCDVMIKNKDNLFSTGSHYGIIEGNNCQFSLDPNSRILSEDSAEVEKELRRRKRTCMGGGSIN